MYKIQTLNKISSKGLNHFPLDNYEVAQLLTKEAMWLLMFM